ncbi:hypothetical protein OSB04_un001156 [Centaurea solstitialis]|uniref:Uncharacterized protein n=1 Tax=Centaurea solstitialis TaxID=347529 RepID=A0AA38S3Q3_9ASTR|nr:hypothetical protein OSB04_un001156 [Centaurea solstitialis]
MRCGLRGCLPGGCSLVIHEVPLTIDLIPTPVSRIDVRVGVDWMFRNQGTVDCAEQLVHIQNPSGGELIVYGKGRLRQLVFCSVVNAREVLGFVLRLISGTKSCIIS